MKTFICYYYKGFGFGAHDSYTVLVSAETENVALELVLTALPNTEASGWRIREWNKKLTIVKDDCT
jgi:hypothetical protein